MCTKDKVHQFLDMVLNLQLINGNVARQIGTDPACTDLYFVEEFDAWSRALLAGIDMDLWVWYLLLTCAIDTSLANTYIAIGIVYTIDLVLVWFRESQGQANLGAKTMFDERFFV